MAGAVLEPVCLQIISALLLSALLSNGTESDFLITGAVFAAETEGLYGFCLTGFAANTGTVICIKHNNKLYVISIFFIAAKIPKKCQRVSPKGFCNNKSANN